MTEVSLQIPRKITTVTSVAIKYLQFIDKDIISKHPPSSKAVFSLWIEWGGIVTDNYISPLFHQKQHEQVIFTLGLKKVKYTEQSYTQ